MGLNPRDQPTTLHSMYIVWTNVNTVQQIQTDKISAKKTHSYPSNDFVFQVCDVLS